MLAWWQHCSKLLLTSALLWKRSPIRTWICKSEHVSSPTHAYMHQSGYKIRPVDVLTEALDCLRNVCSVSSLILIDQKANTSARLSGMFQRSEISKSPLAQACLTKQVNKLWWSSVNTFSSEGYISSFYQRLPLQRSTGTLNGWFDVKRCKRNKQRQGKTPLP